MDVNKNRLKSDILENSECGGFGADGHRGRTVLTGDAADERARDLFVSKLRAAGLEVLVDPVGNIAGRYCPDGAPAECPAVAVGSHLDSVERGGIFDGPLGVYAGLEAVRAIDKATVELERPIEVVSFTEEEGGRFESQLGSSVAVGKRDPEAALSLTDRHGVTLADRLETIGYRGTDAIDAAEWDAWVELHIEQDTTLERAGASVGVVEAITGISNCRVDVEGTADHAGSTGMFERKDALAAMAEIVGAVEEAGRAKSKGTDGTAVATVGELTVEPNVRNIVPGEATATLDIRDVDDNVIAELVGSLERTAARVERERSVGVTVDQYRHDAPSAMADRVVEAAVDGAEDAAVEYRRTHSAGMHDTALVSEVTDAGLLFAPSKDGISHSPREWTDWEDCATATAVLARTVATLAS